MLFGAISLLLWWRSDFWRGIFMRAKIIVLSAMALLNFAAFGQGTILFNTRVVGQVDAPVGVLTGPNGITWFGELGGKAQLYLVSGTSGAPSFTPLFPATTFRDGSQNPFEAAYVVQPASAVVVPGVPAGSPATIVMRAWVGSSFDVGTLRGQTPPITITLGGTPAVGTQIPDAVLVGLPGITIFPEPSTMALGVLGAAALLFWGKRH
jgi:hypothetical protein